MQEFLNKILPTIKKYSANKKDFNKKVKEVTKMLTNVENVVFTTRGQAKKLAGLSYIGGRNSSAKIVKGAKLNYDTVVLYLAASDMSGFNICPMATDGCKAACLVNSGRARMIEKTEKISMTNWARLRKTWLYFFNREFFMSWLNAEIIAHKNRAILQGKNFAVRLNGTSDLDIKLFKVGGKSLLDIHREVQFYDYTKLPKQLKNALDFPNYDVTFSFANTSQFNNNDIAMTALAFGQKISVCFDKESFGGVLPATFLGYEVANGDETDLTFLNELQVLGLDVKRTARKEGQLDNDFIVTKEMLELLEKSLAA